MVTAGLEIWNGMAENIPADINLREIINETLPQNTTLRTKEHETFVCTKKRETQSALIVFGYIALLNELGLVFDSSSSQYKCSSMSNLFALEGRP